MKLKVSNKVYDIGKYIAQIAMPAVATFYAAVGVLWGLPKVTEVVGTITAFDTLLGTLLLISTTQFNKAREERLDGIIRGADPAANQ
jgi:NADH:ubiquinone oxidoreductase subunit 4 (subunit M)